MCARHGHANGADAAPVDELTPVTWPDAERVDRYRLNVGMVAYCPICRRPSTTELLGAPEALDRLARHLVESHDPFFVAALMLRLTRELDRRAGRAVRPVAAPEPLDRPE